MNRSIWASGLTRWLAGTRCNLGGTREKGPWGAFRSGPYIDLHDATICRDGDWSVKHDRQRAKTCEPRVRQQNVQAKLRERSVGRQAATTTTYAPKPLGGNLPYVESGFWSCTGTAFPIANSATGLSKRSSRRNDVGSSQLRHRA